MPRPFLSRFVGIAALCTVAVGTTPSASAHDVLVGTTPQAGTTVSSAPGRLQLRFSEDALALGSEIRVTAPDGTSNTEKPTVSGSIVSAPLKADQPGVYRVAWRVTSADGHPVSNTFQFTVKGAPTTASSSTSAVSSGALGASTASSPSTVTGPSTPTTDEPGDNEPLLVIGGFTAVTALVAGGWFIARRRVHDDPR